MKYALYLGCTVQAEQYGYEASVRQVLPRLGVELVEMQGASCCGFPAFSSISSLGWHYLSARNLAIAGGLDLDVLPLCNGCHLSFTETQHTLGKDPYLRQFIEEKLALEGLKYSEDVRPIHMIELLHDIIGVDRIKEAVERPLEGIKLASHPGCHAIRPSDMQRPDDSEDPTKLDDLARALGATTMDYPDKADCCGSLLSTASGRTTLAIAGEKLKAVRDYGFDGLFTTCPYCFKMFDSRQRAIGAATGDRSLGVPVFYYTQLLGLAMGVEPEKLGLKLNMSPVDGIIERIMGGSS